MLGKFFNSFYYGKAGKSDYTPENLPKNRVQLFFETFRVRWSALIRLNLLYVLFWLPALLWSGWNLLALENLAAMAQAGELAGADFSAQALGILSMYLIVLFPCIAITGPATAGCSYVTRNWARDQHSFLWSDFKDAMKENWKQALIVSTITGALPLLVYVCWQFYGQMASTNSIIFVVPQMLVLLLGLIWLLALEIIYTMMVTYKLSFRQLIRNAVILSVGKLPLTVGIRLITLVVPVIALAVLYLIPASTPYVVLVLLLYVVLFAFAFDRFLYASLANALCEKFINARIEGAETNIGLRKYTDDDYEIDPHMPESLKEEQAKADNREGE